LPLSALALVTRDGHLILRCDLTDPLGGRERLFAALLSISAVPLRADNP
jgi:hypothetical protein